MEAFIIDWVHCHYVTHQLETTCQSVEMPPVHWAPHSIKWPARLKSIIVIIRKQLHVIQEKINYKIIVQNSTSFQDKSINGCYYERALCILGYLISCIPSSCQLIIFMCFPAKLNKRRNQWILLKNYKLHADRKINYLNVSYGLK